MQLLIGYLASAIAFSTVLLLVVSIWRGRLQGWWLLVALTTTMIWAGYIAVAGASKQFNPSNLTFFDILRGSAWSLLLWRLGHISREGGTEQFWSNHWIWVFLAGVACLLGLNVAAGAGIESARFVFYLAPFALSLVVLLLTEQWYRGADRNVRWSIKFLSLALVVMFGSDFLMYSEALLFGRIDAVLWEARGWLCFLMAPLVAISVARCREWRSSSRISRQAVFFGSSLLLAGVYLVVMSLVGYYLRWFGTGLGSAIQVVFLVLSLSALVLVVSSGKYRSALSVWLSKHFLSYKYDYREEWMRANNRFASLSDDEAYFQQLLLGIADPVDSLGGVIWVEEGGAYLIKANWSAHYDSALCDLTEGSLLDFCRRKGWIISLTEYRDFPHHYSGLVLPQAMVEADDLWLIVPLIHQEHLYGLVALASPRTERTVTWEDHDLLKALGGQAAALLALRALNESLAGARQFEAFNQLSTFVVHDLKNVVAQLSLVVSNAERHRNNPEFIDDALETLSSAVGRMKRMLSQLKQRESAAPAVISSISTVLDEVVSAQKGNPPPVLREVEAGLLVKVDRDRLTATLCHLVQNAQDATPDDGHIDVIARGVGNQVQIEVRDSGCGMDQAFIDSSLFKPFVSTKGRAGMGIGAFESRQFAESCGGQLQVSSSPGNGSTFTLLLPKYVQADQPGVACGQG